MKTKFYFAISAVALLASCNNDESVISDNHVVTLGATIEETASSRMGLESTGAFYWTDGDVIGVLGSSDGFQDMKLASGAGQKTATFSSSSFSGTPNGYAVYPYNAEHKIDKTSGKLTYRFPTEYTYTEVDNDFADKNGNSFNMPMWATVESGSVSFKHLGGVIAFKIANLPVGENQTFTFTSTNYQITGDYEVDLRGNEPKLEAKEATENNTVIIKYSNTAVSTRVFYIPLPTGSHSFSISYTGPENTTVTKSWSNISVGVGDQRQTTIGDASVSGGVTTPVTSEATLLAALEAGYSVSLNDNIELTKELSVSENTVIDLNGQSLNAGSNTITVAEGKSLTITDSKAGSTMSLARTATIGTSITGTGDIIRASANSTITIDESVTLTNTAENCCIFIPKSAENVTVNTAGNLSTIGKDGVTNYATIYVNGSVTSGTINITGGSVKHGKDLAVYIAGKTNLNISGNAEIEGTTAVEVRAGEVTVTGGTLKATSETFTATANGNGSTSVGAALAVTQHSTNHELKATISGGTFTGAMALYEEDTCDDGNVSGISMSVTGGTFNGEVSSENCTAFITGGTLSDASAFDYLGEGANVTVGANMGLAKSITITKNATINLNQKKIECKTSDVFVVTTGTLTLEGDESAIVWGSSDNSSSSCAVWAKENGKVVIKGGTYKVGDDTSNGTTGNWRNDCIYARDNASITIEGGTFQYTGNNTVGHTFLLNCRDADYKANKCSITVKGGKFYKFNPGASNGENPVANYLADGCQSTTTETDWYTVTANN